MHLRDEQNTLRRFPRIVVCVGVQVSFESQEYRCANCDKNIPIVDPDNITAEARRCHYDGRWCVVFLGALLRLDSHSRVTKSSFRVYGLDKSGRTDMSSHSCGSNNCHICGTGIARTAMWGMRWWFRHLFCGAGMPRLARCHVGQSIFSS